MNNPPAFPNASNAGNIWNDKGMTLRDYMAAKAMQGMFASDTSFVKEWQDHAAQDAYSMADAMLKAREI